MSEIRKLILNSEIQTALFFLFANIVILLSLNTFTINYFFDTAILVIALLMRKDLYFHRNITYKIDFFRLLVLFYTLLNGIAYTIIISSISIIIVFIIKILTIEEKQMFDIKDKFPQIHTIQKELIKQQQEKYFTEYIIFFLSFFTTFLLFAQLPLLKNNGIFIFTIAFFILWVVLEKIFQNFINNLHFETLNPYIRNLLTKKRNLYNSNLSIILELILHFIFFICLFYTFIDSQIYLLLVFFIFLISLKDNSHISGQVLTFITLIVDLLEKKDRYTFDHSSRVALISYNIAKQLNLGLKDVDRIYKAAMIHDVGKIIVPDEILQKKGKLTQDEFEKIKLHVKELKNILSDVYEFIKEIVDVAELHHERLNGQGYPYGYTAKDIPLESRILAVADTFDALIIDRPYRPGFSFSKAIHILKEDAEKNKLDPFLVDTFIKIIPQTEIMESVKRVKTMLKIYQGKIINNMISSLTDFIDEII